MSLTSHLNDPASPLRLWFEANFPNRREIMGTCRAAGPVTLRPEPPHTEYALVGIALDYRIRYYCAVTPPEDLVAAQGAMMLAGQVAFALGDLNSSGETARRTWDEFASWLQGATQRINPVGRCLPEPAELELCRACYVLACYETLFRAGISPSWPIVLVGRGGGLAALLGLAAEEVVDDLARLSWAFYDTCGGLLGEKAALNPTFGPVSRALGGADADLIIGDRLLDIKTSISPSAKTADLYQLLGYALADTEDKYAIRRVGFYYSRRPSLVLWSLQDYCDVLAGKATDVEDARRAFYTLATSL